MFEKHIILNVHGYLACVKFYIQKEQKSLGFIQILLFESFLHFWNSDQVNIFNNLILNDDLFKYWYQ